MYDRAITAQERRAWRDQELQRFRRDHPAPVKLRFALNLGCPDAKALGFDPGSPPQAGDVLDVDPEVAFTLLRRSWAVEVE